MLGSFEEAEDLVKETFPRAWRRRDSFEGGPGFRAWQWSSCSRPGSGRS
jgi:RNA polymerase sigma-70 factor (ECF subfamily)